MRFQDAAPDARHVVYAGIQADPLVGRVARLLADASYPQRVLARAVMNGESVDRSTWQAIFPTVLGPGAPDRDRALAILAGALEVADKGEEVRSQLRGAIVESLAEVRTDAAEAAVRLAATWSGAEEAFRASRSARNLLANAPDLEEDIAFCARESVLGVVPRLVGIDGAAAEIAA